ncbi:MAG: DDE-type integrase/transposase/recombinase [Thermomicrobiales bacterium]
MTSAVKSDRGSPRRPGPIAAALGLSARTLRHWVKRFRDDPGCANRLITTPRGRPPSRLNRFHRREVLAHLRQTGPRVSIRALRAEFPEVARRELEDLLRRYRFWARRCTIARLRWTTPGAVWAMDFTDVPHPIDGTHPHVLSVRDLASGRQLLALPTTDQCAKTADQALASLFAEHSPPIVLKSDNGSPFKATTTRLLLDDQGVTLLPSPVRTPSYNGSCEAGIGSLKTRCHERACLRGQPEHWTSDDLEAARLQANAATHSQGNQDSTPDVTWKLRQPLKTHQRSLFQSTVQRMRLEVRSDWGYTPDEIIGPRVRDRIDREAIRRGLVAHGYLVIQRRRITLPLTKLKAAKNT